MKLSLSLIVLLTACSNSFGDSITSVSPISTAQIQTITISGSGFGAQSPYTGDSDHILFFDVTRTSWSAGFVGPCPAALNGCGGLTFFNDLVTLIVDSWTDSTIVLGGFSGAWSAGTDWSLASGDQVQFYVWNAQTGGFAGSIITTVGSAAVVPEPDSLALVLGAFAVLGVLGFRRKRERQLRLRRAIAALTGFVVFGIGLAAIPSAKAQVVGAGTFNLAGAVDITGTAFTFGADVAPPPGDQMARTEIPLTGQFSGIAAGVNVPIKNLSAPTVTPGTPFSFTDWITLPDGIDLTLTDIPISGASHICTAADDAPGSICAVAEGSPITLEQGTDGVTMLVNFTGVAYFASSPQTTTPWAGKLACDFSGETISGLLDTFNSTGHITTGYEANFVTTAITTPQQLTQSIINSATALRSQRILNHGEDHSLIVKLQRAINSMNTGHNAAAIRHLNAFIGEVNDLLSDSVLTSSQATPLVSAAQDVIALLS